MLNDDMNPSLEIQGQVRFIFRQHPLKDISLIIYSQKYVLIFQPFRIFTATGSSFPSVLR